MSAGRLSLVLSLLLVSTAAEGAEQQEALTLFEKRKEENWQRLTERFNDLYRRNAQEEALETAHEALALAEDAFGADHRHVATSLTNVALVLKNQGEYDKLEPLLIRALAIRKALLAPDDEAPREAIEPAEAVEPNESAEEEEPSEAVQLAKDIRLAEDVEPTEAEQLAMVLASLGWLYYVEQQDEQAEPLYLKALEIAEAHLEPDDLGLARYLNDLSVMYIEQERYQDARPMLERELELWETTMGKEHPFLIAVLDSYEDVLIQLGDKKRAQSMRGRADRLRRQRDQDLQERKETGFFD